MSEFASKTSAPAVASRSAFFGMAATLLWGSYPIWYKAVARVPVFELLLHRVVWSSVFLVPLTLVVFRKKAEVVAVVRARRSFALVCLSAAVLAAWWLSYTYAVVSGHVLEASLGYFVSPLLTAVCGVVFFRERAQPATLVAVGFALVGVASYLVVHGSLPGYAVLLALCYTGYTVLRKVNKGVDSQAATVVETGLLAPFAVLAFGVLAARGGLSSYAGYGAREAALLFALGVINVLPLWWYGIATKGLSLLALSFLQYVPPTCNFLLAIFLYREPMNVAKLVMFGFIWAGVAVQLTRVALNPPPGAAPAPPAPVPAPGLFPTPDKENT